MRQRSGGQAIRRWVGAVREAGGVVGILAAAVVLTACPPDRLTALAAQTTAITNATVYPVSGPKLEHATVVIQNGKIAAVGTSVTIPNDATRIDGTGKIVTPGLFHARSTLGLSDVGSVDNTNESSHAGDINASFAVAEGIDPATPIIPVARLEGVTTAVTIPTSGLIQGQAALIGLNGTRVEALVRKSPAALVIDLSENSKGAGGGSRAGVLQRLRQLFLDAQEYERRKAEFRKNAMQQLSAPAAELEALGPALRGEEPVMAYANRESDIMSALRLAKEFKLRLVIAGGIDGWKVAPALAEAKVPVIINPINNIPTFDGLGARFDAAALMDKAGVPVIVVEGETGGPRNLRWSAGFAVRFGMSWDNALAAITLRPARALGVDDRYGSLEAGKVADVVVWSGDPLDYASEAEHVFIGGTEMPHTSRQTELLDRYRTLPPAY